MNELPELPAQQKIFIREGEPSQYGYQHWSGKPVDDGHSPLLVPQSIMDGWQCFCSCGKWYAFASFYEYNRRDDLLAALGLVHDRHREGAAAIRSPAKEG